MDGEVMFNELKNLMDSEGLVTARLVESVARTSQMASATLPEIQLLFDQWLSLLGNEVLRIAEPGKDFCIESMAKTIGIGQSSLLALLLSLQRRGDITIESVRIGPGKGANEDICSCLLERP